MKKRQAKSKNKKAVRTRIRRPVRHRLEKLPPLNPLIGSILSPWQPFASAPRDGSRILLACETTAGVEIAIGSWEEGQTTRFGKVVSNFAFWSSTGLSMPAQFWAPLPPLRDVP